MRVIGLVGSPRTGGNTETLVMQALNGAASMGAETEVKSLNLMQIRGCQACMFCKTHPGCAVVDDMTELLDAIDEGVSLIVGTPVYMGQMTAQTKLFVDRLYALFVRGKERSGGSVGLVFTQGAEEEHYAEYRKQTGRIFASLGYRVAGTMVLGGCDSREYARVNEPALAEAWELGRAVAGGNQESATAER